MKNQKGFIIPIIIIFVIIVLGAIAYFYSPKSTGSINIKIPTASPVATNNPTADWKINNNKFVSNYFGFEITFPKNWKLDFSLADWGKNLYILKALNEAKNYSVLIFIASKDGDTLPGPTGFGAGDWKEIGSINLLGQKLVKKALIYENNTENIMYSSFGDRIISYPNSNTLFNFIIYPTGSGQYNIPTEVSNEFDQILSTFKFLDSGTANIISTEELDNGWYWGNINQKKESTPSDWIFLEAGRSSCWHRVGVLCQ